MRRALFFSALVGVAACDDPLSQINLEDIRLSSTTDKHLIVEVDVRATEAGGRNIGNYCVEITFPGQTNIQRVCNNDLTDGDTRTVRIVSDAVIATGGTVLVAARLPTYISSETRIAP